MLTDYPDFLHFAGRGNPGLKQRIESIRLQRLLTGFSFILQSIPFLIGEANHNLVVSQAMGFGFYGLSHLAPSFDLRSKFSGGSKGSEAPLQVSRKVDARSIGRNREA